MHRALRWVVSLGLVVAVVWLADWRHVLAALGHVQYGWVGACIALLMLERVLVTGRWRALLVAHGVRPGFGALLRIQYAANFLGLLLPNAIGVDALRIAGLYRRGVAGPVATAATLVERATQGASWLACGSILIVVFAGAHVPARVTDPVLWLALALGAMALVLALPGVWPRTRAVGRRLVPARLGAVVGRVIEAAGDYRGQHGVFLRVAGWTVLMVVVRVSYTKCITLALGVDLPLAALLVIAPLIAIALMLPITIGGLGVLDVTYVLLMSFAGVPPAVAVGMALVDHLVARVATLPGALFLDEIYRGAPASPQRVGLQARSWETAGTAERGAQRALHRADAAD